MGFDFLLEENGFAHPIPNGYMQSDEAELSQHIEEPHNQVNLENPFSTFFIDDIDSEESLFYEKEHQQEDSYSQGKTLCVILIDHSEAIASHLADVNNTLQIFYREILEDDSLCQRIEIALVSSNSDIGIIQQPSLVENFTVPSMTIVGNTNIIAGIQKAVEVVKERKHYYRDQGVAYKRPWIIIISNGEIDAMILKNNLKQIIDIRDESFYYKGYYIQPLVLDEDANRCFLDTIATNETMKMKDAKFSHFFRWLSTSMV